MHRHAFFVRSIAFFLIALIVAAPFAATARPVFAETDPAVAQCQAVIYSASPSELANPSSKPAQCKTLIELYAQLAEQQAALAKQQGVTGSLNTDIKRLTTQITAKKTEINAKIAHINVLSNSITEKQAAIKTLDQKIETQQESLAQLLRKTNELDQVTFASFLLSSKGLSGFTEDVSRFDTLKAEVKSSMDSIRAVKGVTVQKKAELEKEQDKTIDEKQNLVQAQTALAQQQNTQKTLLSISKNKETEYQKVIAQQQAKVAEIKAKLFQLAGGAQAIRFDQALQYANEAAAKTGIDPAFLLAIATQESSLGKNVGQCYLTNTETGAGVSAKGTQFPNVMKPTRDVQPFIEITEKLGYDWTKTVVSCPIPSAGGYGGAMGPAQFIASTWKIFIARLQTALGHYPNPWTPEDAFMASAMYLTDLGGVGTSASAQLKAACKYYGSGGSTCSYGRSVQTLKTSIQADIDYLLQYGVSRR